jgi:putative ABC transport system permease protein
LEGQRVTADYFRVLGVAPIAGSDFKQADDRPHGPNVVIISDAVWQRHFNADAAIVGRTIHLDDNLYTVAGVMPRAFENVTSPAVSVWTLLQYDPSLPPAGREWGHHLETIARLQPDATAARAKLEVSWLGREMLAELHPETYDPATGFAVTLLRDDLARSVRPGLLAILGAVALVLVIACVNVTNLLLARGARRRTEFGLRAALGAGRVRLCRQLLTESLLLSCIGGAAGVLVAVAGVRAFVALAPAGLPRVEAIAINGPVLVFAVTLTIVIGIALGLIPALQAGRSEPQHSIQHGSPRTVGGHRGVRRVLVVTEVALALVLLVGSGLLFRSLQQLFAVPLGFDPSGLVTLQVQAVGHLYDRDAARQRLFDEELEAVRRVPGVESAGFTSQLPLSGDRDEYGAHFDATPALPEETLPVFRYAVSAGYIESARIPLRAGRAIDAHDDASAPPVAVISESLAKSRFAGTNPIGRQLRLGPSKPYTIVGVAGDVRQVSLALNDAAAVYISAAQSWFADNPRSLVVRAHGDPASLAPAIREAIWSVDKDQPVVRVATLAQLVASSAAERRFALLLFEAFGITALVLAAIGVYGVLAATVTERQREIGLRAALGATRGEIVWMIVRQGLMLTGIGIALGIAGAALASRGLVTLLFGISRLDPVTYLGVVMLLTVTSALASWLPAWRASRVDPSVTLRAE